MNNVNDASTMTENVFYCFFPTRFTSKRQQDSCGPRDLSRVRCHQRRRGKRVTKTVRVRFNYKERPSKSRRVVNYFENQNPLVRITHLFALCTLRVDGVCSPGLISFTTFDLHFFELRYLPRTR